MALSIAKDLPEAHSAAPSVPRIYAWTVFALTFGLLLSDYMSRQVLNAVFPVLKAEWALSDTQLGSLSGIVALLVGILTFPLSVAADRWGRVKSIVLMAGLWSLATLACALAGNYNQMFAARFFVGIGEAAYGSVGVALILSIFPSHLRSTLTGAFMAGGPVGSVLGMTFGGVIAMQFGWRWSFGVMALFGLLLVILYRAVVREDRMTPLSITPRRKTASGKAAGDDFRRLMKGLFGSTAVRLAYVGSGLQLFIMAALVAWMPSYLNRYYHLRTDKAALLAGVFILAGAIGMVLCGIVTDRISRHVPERKWWMAVAYSLISGALLMVAFRLPAGTPQLVLIGAAMLVVAGTSGPAGAMVANLTPTVIHSSAFATLTLMNNLLGLAPGPFVTGFIADRVGLLGSLKIIPLVALGAASAFAIGKRYYASDLKHIQALQN
ncbi:MAG TPA: MFS transporter [Noviherbaspirillum sp.]|uniref:MFS transporter n=1 Tax=Noviherbaspirillum sp. TaxID=1926288 RepID=UPI002B4887BD|nr:MFS transporter [Noviherbaspirillum sp.]HJV86947.1 MFS transporter [Noviherbaspirillum sp.]